MVHARDRLGERAEHRDLILDPEREQVSRSRGHLDAGDDLHRAGAARGEVAQGEGAVDVVVVGERDHVEPDLLCGIEDRVERGKAVAEIAVQLQVGSAHHAASQTGSNTFHCSGWART